MEDPLHSPGGLEGRVTIVVTYSELHKTSVRMRPYAHQSAKVVASDALSADCLVLLV